MALPGQDTERLLDDADIAYISGRFNDAFVIYEEIARLENVGAICGLAQMYLRGEGVDADISKGLELLTHAADLGHANSAYSLGALYRSGAYGISQSRDLSRDYFLLARKLGCDLPVDDYL